MFYLRKKTKNKTKHRPPCLKKNVLKQKSDFLANIGLKKSWRTQHLFGEQELVYSE